jgi:L-2-hydroxyglutarate oxidase LhgO
MTTPSGEVVVIGGGVVGLACAAELAGRGRSVTLLERHPEVGRETSSRNSEVIHAGIYYPVGSLKAQACVAGRDLLYERCARDGVGHRRLGKLIVATSEAERAALEEIAERATANGAGGIRCLDEAEVRRREPRVRACAAIWSPNTGIVDAHALMGSYQAELEAHGGLVVANTRVVGLERRSNSWSIDTLNSNGEHYALDAEWVVNAAGLQADAVASLAGLDVAALGWRIHPCKGDYFSVAPGRGPLTRHLVYPVPAGDGGLGVHVTLDLGGRFRLGPDAHYVDQIDLRVDERKAGAFAEAARRFLPEIEASDLDPEMAGIRPKLQGPGEPFRDFVVAESSEWGAPGMVHLVGIESPGLTAAGALARRAADLFEGRSVG